LRRAIQRYIEDPLADFVLRSELTAGATVMVDTAPEGSEEGVTINIVMPEPKPAPVAVGGPKEGEGDSDAVDDTGALDTPPVPPSDDA
jgi:ATP-dependent Clp protease ATP-binding subunit ClpC